MTKRMLIDATHDEETRVAVVDDKNNRLLEFDYENKYRKPLKGSIFLAKVTRVEPSLQAAFVNFGGNRHGFLPFSEIHPDYYRIPISDREALIEEQEALLAEEEEKREAEEEKGDDQISDVNDDLDEEDDDLDEIEAINADGAAGDNNVDDVEKGEAKSGQGRGRKISKKSDDESENGDDETQAEASEAEEDTDTDNDNEDSENNGNRRGRYNNRRGRRGGRGRGNGRHRRAAHSSQRVEVLGGTEYEDDNSGAERFRFNLRRQYKIQEVIKRGQIMLVQASREERGNKGAAVTTYLSLPGRYGVLMPNSPRSGGVSRKIAKYEDRQRMRKILKDLDVPKGMSVILRTAGVARTKTEIKRDVDYLMRLWNDIRELTLQSSAPALIYEEADLIKRAVRDLYTRDVEEVQVAGDEGYKTARKFMKMMIPSHVKKVKDYKDEKIPLFHKYGVENQISEMSETTARLKSGGYLVINPTEALVSIDVNSGRATKERHIEETALNTNMEAAEEVARQLRLRDLGGLVVVDFIDMEDRRNNARVERKLKEALSQDRARIQIGRISSFGLLEMSRQRLNPSLTEAQFDTCDKCEGRG
ncbi:MAG: Rne/Rng family ribonuclease, partial [Alphaproteobacteria bacterium]